MKKIFAFVLSGIVAVNALASTPYNVAVGGTDFSDTYHNINATYWSVSNTANYGSALSYIPEIPWNDSCAGFLLTKYLGFTSSTGANGLCNNSNAISSGLQNIAAGSGGPSACASGVPSIAGVVSGTCAGYTKPVWQKILGNPGDKRRDLPDVSLFAADGIWGHYYVFCWSDTSQGGANCSGAPSTWSGAGGTSFASPILAGIQALVNQRKGSATGNPAPVYYSIARGEYTNLGVTACNSSLGNNAASACVFHDVTEGDMDVSCASKVNCPAYSAPSATHPAGLVGALKKGGPAFRAKKGWDFATGLGSVNAYNLVINPAW